MPLLRTMISSFGVYLLNAELNIFANKPLSVLFSTHHNSYNFRKKGHFLNS